MIDPDNDMFNCEACEGVFDIEESVRMGRKGPLFCETCAELQK